jgi:Uncharacterized protein conserved in bacteria
MKKDIDLSRRSFITMASTLGLGAAMCPLASLMLPDSAMAAPMVPLRMYNPHTRDRYDVELFVGSKWNENALLVCHHMMRDWRQKKSIQCDRKLFAALYVVQRKFNVESPISINSGYRTPETNNMLRESGAAPNSQHLLGRAVDFAIPGVDPIVVSRYVKTLGIGGVGNYPTFTHMDTRGERVSWGRGI